MYRIVNPESCLNSFAAKCSRTEGSGSSVNYWGRASAESHGHSGRSSPKLHSPWRFPLATIATSPRPAASAATASFQSPIGGCASCVPPELQAPLAQEPRSVEGRALQGGAARSSGPDWSTAWPSSSMLVMGLPQVKA